MRGALSQAAAAAAGTDAAAAIGSVLEGKVPGGDTMATVLAATELEDDSCPCSIGKSAAVAPRQRIAEAVYAAASSAAGTFWRSLIVVGLLRGAAGVIAAAESFKS